LLFNPTSLPPANRLDDMFLSLQLGIRKGDTKSVEVGVRVLTHKAKLNGY